MKDISFKGVFSGKQRAETTGASSSSAGPAPEQKTRGRPKKKSDPEEERPKELPYPGPRGRPRKEPVNPDEPERTTKEKVQTSNQKTIQQTGAPLLHYSSKSVWEKQGKGIVGQQAMLRRIDVYEEIKDAKAKKQGKAKKHYFTVPQLVKQIMEYDKANNLK